MRFPRDFLIELFIAIGTFESLMFAMNPHVLYQILFPRKRFRTHSAREQLLLRMNNHMLFKIRFRIKLAAAVTGVILVSVCHDEVNPVLVPIREYFATLRADVGLRLDAVHLSSVSIPQSQAGESLAAHAADESPAPRVLLHVFPLRF